MKPYSPSWWSGIGLLPLAFCLAVSAVESTEVAPPASVPSGATARGASTTNSTAVLAATNAGPRESGRDRIRDERGPTREGAGAGSPRVDYSSFRLIADRNIFNANRSGRRPASSTGSRPRQVRVETFGLVGTMSYEKGDFAFFDGSSSQFRRVLKPSDSIAGYKIAAISGNGVKLEANGQEIQMKVGAQMRREDEGQWQLSARTESLGNGSSGEVAANSSASTGSNGSSAGADSGAPAGEVNDVLKRLMQQREKEINR